MSRYTVNKVLFDVYSDHETAAAFTSDTDAFLQGRDLEPQERAALADRDVRGLMASGAHPFLIFNFAIQLNGGFSFEFCLDYVGKLQGLSVGDIAT